MIRLRITFAFLFCLLSIGVPLQSQSKQNVSGKCVFIFGPSASESDSVRPDESEALNDFAYYSSKIAIFARSKGMKCEYISARTINIRFGAKRVFSVSRDSVEYGTILTDGIKEPLLLKYVVTDIDMEKEIRDYFEITELSR